jgi:hypothetical protein
MACIVFDGFDSYSTNLPGNMWPRWSAHLTGLGQWGNPGGTNTRFNSGLCLQIQDSNTYVATACQNQARLIWGCGVWANALATRPFFSLLDGATTQATVSLEADGSITVYRGTRTAGTQVAATAAGVVAAGLWGFLEVDLTVDPSAGAVQMWYEGTSVASATGLNTRASGTSQVGSFRLAADEAYGAAILRWDDFYLLDTTGPAPWNDRLGDIRCQTLFPTAAGDLTQFTPDSGSNYARVGSYDSDSSYVASSNVGDTDLYNVTDLPSGFSGTVFGVLHSTRARKDDAGVRTLAQVQKSGSTTTAETAVVLFSSYTGYYTTHVVNPATGSQYTAAEVNALQIGVKVAS